VTADGHLIAAVRAGTVRRRNRKQDRGVPECNSIRSGRGWAEPEVWFRIVHVAMDARNGGPAAAYREQMVEIALGPKGA
jgi:hypothetical protein